MNAKKMTIVTSAQKRDAVSVLTKIGSVMIVPLRNFVKEKVTSEDNERSKRFHL